ncbi:hypothetical protein Bbelb_207660 [Branchiostoma belcheri]|nr:hypothetical protein Bbelb_207660 [Branchiostoma belcheri]
MPRKTIKRAPDEVETVDYCNEEILQDTRYGHVTAASCGPEVCTQPQVLPSHHGAPLPCREHLAHNDENSLVCVTVPDLSSGRMMTTHDNNSQTFPPTPAQKDPKLSISVDTGWRPRDCSFAPGFTTTCGYKETVTLGTLTLTRGGPSRRGCPANITPFLLISVHSSTDAAIAIGNHMFKHNVNYTDSVHISNISSNRHLIKTARHTSDALDVGQGEFTVIYGVNNIYEELLEVTDGRLWRDGDGDRRGGAVVPKALLGACWLDVPLTFHPSAIPEANGFQVRGAKKTRGLRVELTDSLPFIAGQDMSSVVAAEEITRNTGTQTTGAQNKPCMLFLGDSITKRGQGRLPLTITPEEGLAFREVRSSALNLRQLVRTQPRKFKYRISEEIAVLNRPYPKQKGVSQESQRGSGVLNFGACARGTAGFSEGDPPRGWRAKVARLLVNTARSKRTMC